MAAWAMTELPTLTAGTENPLSNTDRLDGAVMRFAGRLELGTGGRPRGCSGWVGNRKEVFEGCIAELAV